jgi:hypothetical protein
MILNQKLYIYFIKFILECTFTIKDFILLFK